MIRKKCTKRGHRFVEAEGLMLPVVFCSRWFCSVKAVSRWAPPELAVEMHNSIPREDRYPRAVFYPDGTVKEVY